MPVPAYHTKEPSAAVPGEGFCRHLSCGSWINLPGTRAGQKALGRGLALVTPRKGGE